jgi:2-amino-4-hydroxy-6-hydroxymethyldihydropteridine diphosphokinase
MATLALIGLGSNLGDRKANLDLAVATLSATPGVALRGVSSYRETPPVGGPADQGAFLNAAAALETTLDPEALLAVLHDVEARAGRERTVRWGKRTLDLDLLLFGDLILRSPRLTVPHPRMALRRFVLAPLTEVAADAVDPVTGRTVRGLLANLDRRPGYVAIACAPRLSWRLMLAPGPHAIAATALGLEGDGDQFRDRLCQALPAVAVEARVPDEELERIKAEATVLDALRGLSPDVSGWAAGWLAPAACEALAPGDGWLVSSFWFDALFLSLDSLKTTRPRYRRFLEQFLEARARVLAPTFVVARPQDRERLGIHDQRYAWQRPIGWDAPVLAVDDFESEDALADVLAACTATRAG